MQVAYEHERIAPQEDLARFLLEDTLEDVLIAPHESLVDSYSSESNDIATVNVDTGTEIGTALNDAAATVSSFMSAYNSKNIQKDIGAVNKASRPSSITELKHDEGLELDKLFGMIGSSQVTRSKMEMSSPWLVQKGWTEEVEQNRQSA